MFLPNWTQQTNPCGIREQYSGIGYQIHCHVYAADSVCHVLYTIAAAYANIVIHPACLYVDLPTHYYLFPFVHQVAFRAPPVTTIRALINLALQNKLPFNSCVVYILSMSNPQRLLLFTTQILCVGPQRSLTTDWMQTAGHKLLYE